jgi:hypothetical protein
VPEAEVEPFPWKIVAAIAAVLLVGGGVLAYVLPNEEVSVSASFTVDPEAATVGDEITLDASASTVTGADDLTYSWRLSAPGQSDAIFSPPRAEITSFTADVHGDYEVELEVTAGEVSDSDRKTIEAFGRLVRARTNQSKCMHKRENNWNNGNPIHLWDCEAGRAEFKIWAYEEKTGYVRSAVNPAKCMHKREANWNNGNPIHLWDCEAGREEFKSWTYEEETGYIRSAVNPAKCMHKRENNWDNGNPIHLWDCDAGVDEFKSWDFGVASPN